MGDGTESERITVGRRVPGIFKFQALLSFGLGIWLFWPFPHTHSALMNSISAKRFPRNSDLATVLAYVANAAGRKEEARQAIVAALAIDPSNRSAQSLKEQIEGK